MKALGKSTQYLQTLNVPEFKTNLEDSGLEYGNLLNCDNKQLEEYLLVYGGFKAYLEGQVSDAVTKSNAIEAAFNEGYATAIYGKWHLGHQKKFLPNNHGFDTYGRHRLR